MSDEGAQAALGRAEASREAEHERLTDEGKNTDSRAPGGEPGGGAGADE